MKLRAVLKGLDFNLPEKILTLEVAGVCQDSRVFKPGDVFVAIKGEKFDGHAFANEARARGAAAVITEHAGTLAANGDSSPESAKTAASALAPAIVVNDSRRALDLVAANYYGRPSEKLFVVGVTGTNGKTTTTNMIEAILNQGQILTGVIGTIDAHLGAHKSATTHTTPEALSLQRQLSQWLSEGAKAVSMEVSSHALALKRVESLEFDVAAFTNLTRDHLDFHHTVEEYAQAKARLFRELLTRSSKKNKRAVLNGEADYWQQMKPEGVPVWTYGFTTGDIQARHLKMGFDGTEFKAETPAGSFGVTMPMIGRHNVANALCAIGVGLHAGVAAQDVAAGLARLPGVAGRLQRVDARSRIRVFVDYAHTDDALTNVLGFLKDLRDRTDTASKILTVFGCGGDRDRGKRPLMLKAALKFSDAVIVTSDNPRTEDPQAIIGDILAGAPAESRGQILVEVDRKKAIVLAIDSARAGDVILIAGKGHENYQIIGTTKIPFDDATIAKEILDT